MNHPRATKITKKQYFLQRLQNIDDQFRRCKPFVFASHYFLEREGFEKRVNISCQRGKIEDGNFNQINDPMNVFDEIRGTPRYWQKKKREIMAKIQQLGPCQFLQLLKLCSKV